MKKFLLTATAIAALSAMSTAALAVDLDTGLGGPTYAIELVVGGTTTVTGAALDVTHLVGPGINASALRYFRYELTNAKYTAQVADTDLVIPGVPAPQIIRVQGGLVGDNYVIFQVTSPATPPGVPAGTTVNYNLGTGTGQVAPDSTGSPIGLTYEMHEELFSAQGNDTKLLYSKSNSVGSFIVGHEFLVTNQNTTTADVASLYNLFLDGIGAPPPTALARIGNFTSGVAAGAVRPDGTPVTQPNDLYRGGTKLVVMTDSDWSSLATNDGSSVYLSTAPNACVPSAVVGSNQTANTIDLVINAGAFTDRAICYQARGTAPIAVQNFSSASTWFLRRPRPVLGRRPPRTRARSTWVSSSATALC
jgi:hypothetical protein